MKTSQQVIGSFFHSLTKVHSVLALDAQALLDSNANEDEASPRSWKGPWKVSRPGGLRIVILNFP